MTSTWSQEPDAQAEAQAQPQPDALDGQAASGQADSEPDSHGAQDEGARWLTTSQAAAALGCSERTIQRRCRRGTLKARLITTSGGQEWQIEAATLQAPDATSQAATGAASGKRARPNGHAHHSAPLDGDDLDGQRHGPGSEVPPRVPPEVPTPTTGDASTDDTPANVPTGAATVPPSSDSASVGGGARAPTGAATVPPSADSSHERDAASTFQQHLLQENAFLRGVIEQQQRDAAELRAALREALKMSQKALPASTWEPASTSSPVAASSTSTPEEPPKYLQSAATSTPSTAPEPTNNPTRRPRRAPRSLWQIILGIRPRE